MASKKLYKVRPRPTGFSFILFSMQINPFDPEDPPTLTDKELKALEALEFGRLVMKLSPNMQAALYVLLQGMVEAESMARILDQMPPGFA